jgi:DnaJ-class molecular chaperone
MKTNIVKNLSTGTTELAKQADCPRCSGHGRVLQDEEKTCFLCKGNGIVWLSRNGWTRPLYGRIGQSEQLW